MCEVTDEIKFHVPPQYFETVSCSCYVKAKVHKGSFDIIVVGTLNGQIIEFSRKKVLNACEIKRGCKTESIRFFASYNPFLFYYIVKFVSEVYVVTREQTLKVFHSFNNVKKLCINDFSNVGAPQLGLWFTNKPSSDLPHLATDFSEQSASSSTLCDEFSGLYQKRLQEIRLKSRQLEKDLETKRQFRFSCTQELMKMQLKECSPCEELVCILGDRNVTSLQQEKITGARLELRNIWQKVHNEKWIIGIQVVNKGERPIVNTQLLLKAADKTTTYNTFLYSKRGPDIGAEDVSYSPLTIEWENPRTLRTDVLVTAVAVFALSSQVLESDLVVRGVVLYKVGDDAGADFQLPLPQIHFNIDTYARGGYSLFLNPPSVTENDLLSIIISSASYKLFTSQSVTEILMKEYGFSQMSEYGKFYCCNKSFPLYGILLEVWLESGHYHLIIHSKDLAQAFSLIQCMKQYFPSDLEVVDLKADKMIDIRNMYESLEAEIDLTSNWLIKLQKKTNIENDEICVANKEYLQFRTSLCELEQKTDELEVQKSLIKL